MIYKGSSWNRKLPVSGSRIEIFYLIQIPLQYQELLYSLQANWNFELTFQGEHVFLRTEEAEMLEENSVRSIPGLKLWVLKKGMLFGIRDLLPTKVAPEFIWQHPEEEKNRESENLPEFLFEITASQLQRDPDLVDVLNRLRPHDRELWRDVHRFVDQKTFRKK